jgi:DNA-directed RNA polymerase sigma subunit (sigma70/sigma32)
VVTFRFGLAGGPPLTLKEIGEKMGISRERVRQIECQAKTRLRKLFTRKRMVKSPSKQPFPVSRIPRRARLSH